MVEIKKEKQEDAEFSSVEDMVDYLRSAKIAIKDRVDVVLDIDGNQKNITFERRDNPDGSRGGFVATSVSRLHVAASYVDSTAIIYGNFDITNSHIGPNATIISLGKDTIYSTGGDQNVIIDTDIGMDSTLKAFGKKSCIVLRGAKIGDQVDIDVQKGRLYVARATVENGVTTETLVSDPDNLEILTIEESVVGKYSKISLDKQPPRLGISNLNIPEHSAISIDMDNYAMEVQQPGKMPNDPYTIIVPKPTNRTLAAFINNAETYANKMSLTPKYISQLHMFAGNAKRLKKLERAILLAKYVYDTIPYDGATYEKYGDPANVPLDYFIKNKGGVCFEHALLLYEILEKERQDGTLDVKPMFVTGAAIGKDADSLHAWVEVEIDGEVFVIDPTNAMPYTIAGMRDINNGFIRIYGVPGYDYVYDGQPVIKPL